MRNKRFLFAVLLVVAGIFGSATAQVSLPCQSQAPLTIPFSSGSITISYQMCFSPSLYWSSTMTYNNVSFDGSFRINGSMNMQLNFSGSSISSAVFSGGPLTYTISGAPYTVSFNNLTFQFNSLFQPAGASGSLVINGVSYPASTQYWAYLFRS